MEHQIFLIFGDEFLVAEKAKQKIADLLPEDQRTLGLEVIDASADTVEAARKSLISCREALQTVGFFGSTKVVWLKDANFLTDNVVGRSKDTKEELKRLSDVLRAGLLPEQVFLVTSEKVDKRYGFYKLCDQEGKIWEFSIPDKAHLSEQQARERLGEMLRKYRLKADEETAAAFLERVGLNTRQIANEVEKLSLYVAPETRVTKADVENVTAYSRESPVWDLADAFGRRDLGRCLELLRRLLFQKCAPIRLVVSLETRIRELTMYREALDGGWIRAADRGGVRWVVPEDVGEILSHSLDRDPRKTHPYRMRLLAEQARRFSRNELKRCRQAVMESHQKLVTTAIPPQLVLEMMMFRLLA